MNTEFIGRIAFKANEVSSLDLQISEIADFVERLRAFTGVEPLIFSYIRIGNCTVNPVDIDPDIFCDYLCDLHMALIRRKVIKLEELKKILSCIK